MFVGYWSLEEGYHWVLFEVQVEFLIKMLEQGFALHLIVVLGKGEAITTGNSVCCILVHRNLWGKLMARLLFVDVDM